MNPTAWQPTRDVDFVLRFNDKFGPAIKAMVLGAAQSHAPPEDQAREALRALARAVGAATHAYIGAATPAPLAAVRIPTNADEDGTILGLRLHLTVPMTQPVDPSSGQAVAGLLQAIMGLARGAIARAEVAVPAVTRDGAAPLLTTVNPQTLPGQKLCAWCRNPMPAYETQCQSCGGRAQT